MIYFSALLISMFITVTLIPFLRSAAIRLHAMDIPDKRKIHTRPMPRMGGLAMAASVLFPVLFWAHGTPAVRAVLIGAGVVALVGVIDDFKGLGYKGKFAGQIAAALVVILYGGIKIQSLGMLLPDEVLLPGWLAILLTLLVIVGVTNAINLADGLDGLAGGISILCFICIGYLAYRGGNTVILLMSVSVVGAILGFLRFNTYPATIFMGDAGSYFLGFLAITLSLALTQGNTPLSPLLPLLLLGFPVLDTLTVMLERIHKRLSPFLPDNNHFHHRLIGLGLFHTEAVFVIYFLQAVLVGSAFLLRYYSEWLILILYTLFSTVLLAGFYLTARAGWKLKRPGIIDRVIKGRLRVLKDKSILIRVAFRLLAVCLPLLLLLTCFLPVKIPLSLAFFSLGLLGLILVTWFFKNEWVGAVLGLSLYLLIPFLIFLSEADKAGWMSDVLSRPYNLSFGLLTLFVMVTLKFTRRREGFKPTPMDFLILLIALVVPNLPDEIFQGHHMGLIAVKIIVLFFSYEVLIGELRGDLKRLGAATVATLAVIALRGFLG